MNRKYAYAILALTFFCLILIFSFFIGNRAQQPIPKKVQVDPPPFLTYISGTGIVEPASGNVVIDSPLNRIVEKINVAVNDRVKKGDILFQLYNEDLKANLKIKQKKYAESVSNLQKLAALPQEQDLTIAEETLNKAEATFNQAKIEYCLAIKRARTLEEKWIQFYKYQQAKADFLVAQAQFEKVESGTWQPELKIAEDQVEQAKADLNATLIQIEQTYVKSPFNGTILQIKIHEGETLDQNKIPLILGNIDVLYLRVSIDQFNESKFHSDSAAVAFKHGDTSTEFPLKFIHMEPTMVPKKYLTNELHEKVDTETFEILYRIEKSDCHLFIGQQMDVYIYNK